MHASPPDSDQTDVIDRIDAGHTGQFPAVAPVVACPFPHHQAAWKWVRWALLVLVYATLGMWAYALVRLGILFWVWG